MRATACSRGDIRIAHPRRDDVADLAAPTQEEIEAARIARKLAAQNDGRKPDGKKLSIGEELAEEQKKEKALKKRSELS